MSENEPEKQADAGWGNSAGREDGGWGACDGQEAGARGADGVRDAGDTQQVGDGAVHLSDEEFEQAVSDAIDALPEEFLDELDNVVFLVEDEPTPEQDPSGRMLGLYDGLPLTKRGDGYGSVDDWPDTITVFKGPHERLSGDREVVLEEIRRTVVHEVGHYFGMDEEQIDEMGYA